MYNLYLNKLWFILNEKIMSFDLHSNTLNYASHLKSIPFEYILAIQPWRFCSSYNVSDYADIWVIIKKHALFCYYAIKRQISAKLIGENMFCMKAHQLSIVLPSKSRLVLLRIYTSYTKTCFFLGVTCYFSRMTYFWSFVLFRHYDFIRSLYYFLTIPKTLIAQHYFCLIYIEI
jgi:hypothetical protein